MDTGLNKTSYRLTFSTEISLSSANNLQDSIADVLSRDDFGNLTILFASDGGRTEQSQALYNFIRLLGVPIRMHAIGHVGSCGVPVFLAGQKRSCEPNARFFVHEYDWTFEGRQTLKRIDEAVQRLRSDIQFAREAIKRHTKAPANLLDALDGSSSATVLSAEQAQSLGFVDGVFELGQSEPKGMEISTWTAH